MLLNLIASDLALMVCSSQLYVPTVDLWNTGSSSQRTPTQGRFYVQVRFRAGAIAPSKPRPCPEIWHETVFDELKSWQYRCKKERSVTFKIRQYAFPVVDLPRTCTVLGKLTNPEGTPQVTPLPTQHLDFPRLIRRLPLGSSSAAFFTPKYFSLELPSRFRVG